VHFALPGFNSARLGATVAAGPGEPRSAGAARPRSSQLSPIRAARIDVRSLRGAARQGLCTAPPIRAAPFQQSPSVRHCSSGRRCVRHRSRAAAGSPKPPRGAARQSLCTAPPMRAALFQRPAMRAAPFPRRGWVAEAAARRRPPGSLHGSADPCTPFQLSPIRAAPFPRRGSVAAAAVWLRSVPEVPVTVLRLRPGPSHSLGGERSRSSWRGRRGAPASGCASERCRRSPTLLAHHSGAEDLPDARSIVALQHKAWRKRRGVRSSAPDATYS